MEGGYHTVESVAYATKRQLMAIKGLSGLAVEFARAPALDRLRLLLSWLLVSFNTSLRRLVFVFPCIDDRRFCESVDYSGVRCHAREILPLRFASF
jgi:hypothetical protein